MTMKVNYSLLRDNFVNELVSDRANTFRETTPTRPPTHSRVQGHLSGNVQRGACGSPAGGRMRATAAKERKKRKESLGGGKTPSLCPRHRHRSHVVVPRRRRGPTGKRQRRAPSGVGGGGTSGEGGENATALDGVGQPTDGRLVGAPEVRGLSLSVKEGPGGEQRVPSPSPCSSPLRRLCLSPFGGVQSSRASRATRTLPSDILSSLENHPKILEATKQLLSLRGWRPSSVVEGGGRSAWRANFRELEEDAKRTALFGRGLEKTTPTSSPS